MLTCDTGSLRHTFPALCGLEMLSHSNQKVPNPAASKENVPGISKFLENAKHVRDFQRFTISVLLYNN